jgi:hypothetical protein
MTVEFLLDLAPYRVFAYSRSAAWQQKLGVFAGQHPKLNYCSRKRVGEQGLKKAYVG